MNREIMNTVEKRDQTENGAYLMVAKARVVVIKKGPKKEPGEERRRGDDLGVYEKGHSANNYREQREETRDRRREEYEPSHRNKMDRRDNEKGYVDDRHREKRDKI